MHPLRTHALNLLLQTARAWALITVRGAVFLVSLMADTGGLTVVQLDRLELDMLFQGWLKTGFVVQWTV